MTDGSVTNTELTTHRCEKPELGLETCSDGETCLEGKFFTPDLKDTKMTMTDFAGQMFCIDESNIKIQGDSETDTFTQLVFKFEFCRIANCKPQFA